MDVSAIIYAALGGGIGGLLGPLLGRLINKEGTKKGLMGVISAVFILVGYQASTLLYKSMKLPRIFPLDTNELIEAVPVLEFIKTEDPATFKEIIYPIDKAVRNNNITQDTLNDVRKKYSEILETKKKTASVETLKAEHDVAVELFKVLKDKAPVVCTQKLHNRPFQDISSFVPPEYAAQEQQAMTNFFTAKSRDENLSPDVIAGEIVFTAMIQRIVNELNITDLDPSIDRELENKKVCDYQIMINTELNELEDKDFLDVYGYMYSK